MLLDRLLNRFTISGRTLRTHEVKILMGVFSRKERYVRIDDAAITLYFSPNRISARLEIIHRIISRRIRRGLAMEAPGLLVNADCRPGNGSSHVACHKTVYTGAITRVGAE